MLGSLEFQRICELVQVIDVYIHIIATGSKEPGVMRRESHFFRWVSMVRKNIQGLSEVSQIPKANGFVSRPSCDVLIIFVEI